MTEPAFNPHAHVRQLRMHGQTIAYLDVKWRLIWLRDEHPDAQITTEHVQLGAERVVFRATVVIPGGGSATGYGSADSVEAAETNALGRALLALGYGAAFAADHVLPATEDEPLNVPAAPASTPGASAVPGGLPAGVTVGPGGGRELPPKLAAIFAQAQPIVDDDPESLPVAPSEPAAAATPPTEVGAAAPTIVPPPETALPTPTPEPTRVVREKAPPHAPPSTGGPPPSMPSVRRADPPPRGVPPSLTARERDRTTPSVDSRSRPPTAATPRPSSAPADDDDEETRSLEAASDNDWSAFWPWARGRGYYNRDDIEKAIGQPIRGRTPREVRTLIINLDEP